MIGKIISHYKITEQLGAGGMGVVYKAEDTKLKRTVALKFLPPALSADKQAKTRFIHEAQAASALDHPNICTIHEIGETEDGQSYIAMACYDGQSLKDKFAGARGDVPLSLNEAVDIIIQIAKGLARAHEEGLVHRDIKPANIMITKRNEVKILDFGLAKLAGQTRLTKDGMTLGTIAYMSPEQARGDNVDQRSDIWSLGVMMYEMLSGDLPFRGDYDQAVIYSILNEEPKELVVDDEIPQEFHAIITKALAKDPADRYRSMEEMLNDFKPLSAEAVLIREESISQFMMRMLKKKRVRYTTITAGTLLTVTIAFLFLRPVIFRDLLTAAPMPMAVIAFENNTGDESYNNLKQAIPSLLITSLAQSQRFQVISLPKLNELRNQMDKERTGEIDTELGFEICRRYGIPLIVVGSFVKAGDIFATDVKVMDVEDKTILASAGSRGEGINSLIEKQIDDMGMQIVGQFGFATKEFTQAYKPIKMATTHSLDAYNFYIKAVELVHNFRGNEAGKFIKLAIQADSTFASAYMELAIQSENEKERNEAIRKARLYAENIPEPERLLIEGRSRFWLKGEIDTAIKILEEAVTKYPTDYRLFQNLGLYYFARGDGKNALKNYRRSAELEPYRAITWNQLAYLYSSYHEYEQAITAIEKCIALSPGEPNPYDTMGEVCIELGQVERAIESFQMAIQLGWKGDLVKMAYAYALKEDYAASIRLWQECIQQKCMGDRPDFEAFMQAFYLYFQGRHQEMITELEKIAALPDSTEYLIISDLFKSWIFYQDSSFSKSIRDMNNSMASLLRLYRRSRSRGTILTAHRYYHAGLVHIRKNQPDSARYFLTKIDSMPPINHDINKQFPKYYRDCLQLEILLAENNIRDALARIDSVKIPELAAQYYPNLIIINLPFREDIIPRLYIKNNDLDKAIEAYENMTTIDPKGSTDRRIIPPWYHYKLARLYEQNDQIDEAIDRYRHFLNVWKNADENLPEKTDAQKRLARLTNPDSKI